MSQAQLISADHFAPSVSIHNGRPATTSLEVAKFFGKRHGNVLRTLNDLMANTPKEFTGLNFELSEYTDETGRVLPMFILHRDGFMLLVMGYTGKKAMQIKVAYILAFNKMEAQIAGNALPPSHSTALTKSTTSSRKPLEKLIKVWAAQQGIIVAQCWTMVNAAFNLQSITELPEEWIPDAIAWVQGKIDAQPKALPTHAEQAAASALSVYKGNLPPDYRSHAEVKASLRRIQDDMMDAALDLKKSLENINFRVHQAFNNPERRGNIATETDRVLKHFIRALANSSIAVEEGTMSCYESLEGLISLAAVIENPQQAGRPMMHRVQSFDA